MIQCAIVGVAAISFVVGATTTPIIRAVESPPASQSDSERAVLATQIRELVEQLQAVRRERLEADERHRAVLAQLDRQIGTLESQLESSERFVADQRQEIASLDASLAADEKSAADAKAWIDLVADRVAPFADRAKRRIERSATPDASVRVADMADALKLLRADDSQHRAEGASDALRLVGEDWQTARTVSVTNEPIVFDGGDRSQHAWVYRLGLASKAFVSEDGQTVGLWSGDPRSPWRLDLPEAERERIRDLFAVVREKQPPAVVAVPVLIDTPPPAEGE